MQKYLKLLNLFDLHKLPIELTRNLRILSYRKGKEVKRSICYINISNFPIAVERNINRKLIDCPVGVRCPYGNETLMSVSDQAKSYGLYKGMKVSYAKRQCPGLLVINPHLNIYTKINNQIGMFLNDRVSRFEFERKGKVYIDYTELEKLYGNVIDFSKSLQIKLEEALNLKISIGIGENKLISKLASKSLRGSSGVFHVNKSQVQNFLNPLPINVLPIIKKLSQKKNILESFADLQILKIEDLARLEGPQLELLFGRFGKEVGRLSKGIDPETVIFQKEKIYLYDEFNLEVPTNNEHIISRVLWKMFENLLYRLRTSGNIADSYGAFFYTKNNGHLNIVKTHPKEFLSSSLIRANIPNLLRLLKKKRTSVYKVSVEIYNIEKAYPQLNLFAKKNDLVTSIDHIKLRYGENSIHWGK